jgi:hypothetical protein
VLPETVQTVGVVEANVTVNPAGVVVALKVADPNAVPLVRARKVIVGVARPTLIVCETEFAAYAVVAAVEAVTVHAPPIK